MFTFRNFIFWLAIGTLDVCNARLSISLTNMSNFEAETYTYIDNDFLSTRAANTDNVMRGYLHQPSPKDGCSYIERIPTSSRWVLWFAVIEGYPKCPNSTITYVRNAGYDLIIASNPNDSFLTLTPEVRNLGFPIVLVEDWFFNNYLLPSLSSFDKPEVEATVITESQFLLLIVVIVAAFVILPCIFICCLCCVFCINRYRRHRFEREIMEIDTRQRNYNQFQTRDRIARQELIESILRQLQQLQVDVQAQTPLGKERTQQLPTKRFSKLNHQETETCAICVEDFKEGDRLRVLPCDHSFHIKCIDEWLVNHSDLCPLCKARVPGDQSESQEARTGVLDSSDTTSSEVPGRSSAEERLLPFSGGQSYGSV